MTREHQYLIHIIYNYQEKQIKTTYVSKHSNMRTNVIYIRESVVPLTFLIHWIRPYIQIAFFGIKVSFIHF